MVACAGGLLSIPKPEGQCGVDRCRGPGMVSIHVRKCMSKTITFFIFVTILHHKETTGK
jgi:hypothetical protein